MEGPIYDREGNRLYHNATILVKDIQSSGDKVRPNVIHGLASILESEELRYVEESGHLSPTFGRDHHNIGRLEKLVLGMIDLLEMISSGDRYSSSVQLAAARLLLSCPSTWTEPLPFGHKVPEIITNCLIDEDLNDRDSEIVKTYAMGLLAVYLLHNPHVAKEVLESGLSARVISYLLTRFLERSTTIQTDVRCEATADVPETVREVVVDELRTERDHETRGLKKDDDLPISRCKVMWTRISGGETSSISGIKLRLKEDGVSALENAETSGALDANMHLSETDANSVILGQTNYESHFMRVKDCTINISDPIEASGKAAAVDGEKSNVAETVVANVSNFGRSFDTRRYEAVLDKETEAKFFLDKNVLAQLREDYSVYCICYLGACASKLNSLGPLEDKQGVDVFIKLLAWRFERIENKIAKISVSEVLHVICELTAHPTFATSFLTRGGVQEALAVPRVHQTLPDLGCLLNLIGSSKNLLQYVCTLPSVIVSRVVELALNFFKTLENVVLVLLANLLRSIDNELQKLDKIFLLAACRGLQGYFRAHLLVLVESFGKRTGRIAPNASSVKNACRLLDISNKSVDALFDKIQQSSTLGTEFARLTSWPAVDTFLHSDGHVTILNLCEVASRRGLSGMSRCAFSVLRIITLLPRSRELIVRTKMPEGCDAMATILSATHKSLKDQAVREVLNVLVNFVCSHPLCDNHLPTLSQGQEYGAGVDNSVPSPLVQCYWKARELVQANRGIWRLLDILHSDSMHGFLRVLACRVLTGLARDRRLARIFKMIEVQKKLLPIIDDSGNNQTAGNEQQTRCQAELSNVALELLRMVTNSHDTRKLVPKKVATSTLSLTESAAIASDTYITYNSRELLLLIHDHLRLCGLEKSAASLLNEAKLEPLPSLASPALVPYRESELPLLPWPCRVPQNPQFHSSIPSESNATSLCPPTTPIISEHQTLSDIVIEYLTEQHRICPTPSTTLPPISLLHRHSCRRSTQCEPANLTRRLSSREYGNCFGGIRRGRSGDNKMVYTKFFPWHIEDSLLESITFLGDSYRFAVGSHSGDIMIFDAKSGHLMERSANVHHSAVLCIRSTLLQSNRLLLSSAPESTMLWNASSLLDGPMHSFDDFTCANFCNKGDAFAAICTQWSLHEIPLFDVETFQEQRSFQYSWPEYPLHVYSSPHFNHFDDLILWNGNIWDRRQNNSIHVFDRLTDCGGGGFLPCGNKVMVNSELYDVRNYKLLSSCSALDTTTLTVNGSAAVLYAIARRASPRVEDACTEVRRRHRLYDSFSTTNAIQFSSISTFSVGDCVLDLAIDPSDSLVGLVALDGQTHDIYNLKSVVKLYKVGQVTPVFEDEF